MIIDEHVYSILIFEVQEVYFLAVEHELVLSFSHDLEALAVPDCIDVLGWLVPSGPPADVACRSSAALLYRTDLLEIEVKLLSLERIHVLLLRSEHIILEQLRRLLLQVAGET